jgi:hypothetical protein
VSIFMPSYRFNPLPPKQMPSNGILRSSTFGIQDDSPCIQASRSVTIAGEPVIITPDSVSTDGNASPANTLITVIFASDDPIERLIQSSKSPKFCRMAGKVEPALMIIIAFMEVVNVALSPQPVSSRRLNFYKQRLNSATFAHWLMSAGSERHRACVANPAPPNRRPNLPDSV